MKVIYYSPYLNPAAVVAGLLHTRSIMPENAAGLLSRKQMRMKIPSGQLPCLNFYGKGSHGEEVYTVTASFPDDLLINSLGGMLTACRCNRNDYIVVNPLLGKNLCLNIMLRITGDKGPGDRLRRTVIKEINACVERSRLQAELYLKGVEESVCLLSTSVSEVPTLP